MNRATSILSFSALGHLIVIDIVYYFLSPSIDINFLIILSYNIIWLFIAILISTSAHKETVNNHQSQSKNYLN